MYLNEEFIINALPGVTFQGSAFPEKATFAIDSRQLHKGDLFIALPGAQTDGHCFIKEAVQKGAVGLMIEERQKECLSCIDANILKKICVVIVPNTFNALIALATKWRQQFDYHVVAITGSVGKTSVKEQLCKILDLTNAMYLATKGNQNTAIGLALNVLRMNAQHSCAIFELGISRRGEMHKLVSIAQPTCALITTIGHSHMEGLGSITDIAQEKRDVFSAFKEDSIGVVNGDHPLLAHVAYNHPVIKFGSKTTNQIQARKVHVGSNSSSFVLKIYKQKFSITLPTNHKGAVDNALAAASLAYLLQVPEAIIAKGIQSPPIIPGRFEQCAIKDNKGTIINDTYNASPESMKAALLAFERFDTDAQKIVVLGDMLELGVNSPFWHRQLGRFLRKVPSVRSVVLVGTQVEWTKKTVPVGVHVEHVATWKQAEGLLEKQAAKQVLVLVKGSRMIGLDNLVSAMCVQAAQ